MSEARMSAAPTQQPRVVAKPGYDAYASADAGYVSGPAVIAYGEYAGWDPDPFIRLQLMRDPGLLAN